MTEVNKLKKVFESWFIKQFKAKNKILLEPFNEKDGYGDDFVNSLWIGFVAGYNLHEMGL